MKPILDELRLSAILFDEVIYPRKDHDPVLVQKYATVLDQIESKGQYIAVSSDNKLLDGKHRWLAYRKVHEADGDPMIKVVRYNVSTPHEQLKLAAQLNSEHGWQLSEEDKKSTALSLYSFGCTYEDIADTLSVGKAKVSDWLSRTVKEEKDRRNQKIFDLWLACHTQEEIAEVCGCDQDTVSEQLKVLRKKFLETESVKAAASHATDFDIPLYNIWKRQDRTPGSAHFGNTEIRWLDNLLYLHTQPFDVVVDPFAGGGSTIDICKKRLRRYWVGDRKPIVEREKDIRQWDLTDGLPSLSRWKDVKLIYLDPPYWKQAEGQYSTDSTDFANMDLETFTSSLSGIILAFSKKISDAFVALIIQPTQWKAPEKQFTDHVGDMLKAVKLPVVMRYSVPYETQQCTPSMVEWAKENKFCLVLTREIVVWKV